MKINRNVWRHINKHHSVIYHSVSGGRDSLFALLNMLDEPNLKVPIIPLFNNTGLNCKSALKTIEKISELCPGTTFEPKKINSKKCVPGQNHTKIRNLITLKPCLDRTKYSGQRLTDVLKESFLNLPQAESLWLEGKYSKKVFPCCYYLKERPLIQFAKTTDSMALFTRSIRGGESKNRQIYLAKLRATSEYFNFDKKIKRFVFYPLRDTNEKEVKDYLLNTDFWETEKSGCRICPVLVLFNLTNEKVRFDRSLRFYQKIIR